MPAVRLPHSPGMTMNNSLSIFMRLFAGLLLLVTFLLGGSAAHAQTVPGTTITDPAATPAPPDIDNLAAFQSQSVPGTMVAGTVYSVSVTMKNVGAATWTDGMLYRLGSLSPKDNFTWGLNRVTLGGASVPYWGVKTFTFQVTAPSVPGSYPFHWGMVQDGIEWFGASAPPVTVNVTAPASLVNKAEVVGASAPARVVSGQSFNVSVTMKNTGTTTWNPGVHKLGAQNPADNYIWMTGANRVGLGASVRPGEHYQFTFSVKAPAPGNYAMQWQMVQEYVEWFGAKSNSPIIVDPATTPPPPPPTTSAPSVTVQRNPTPMTAGQAFTLTWSTTNASTLKRVCTASGTGFTVNESLATSGTSSGTANAAWVNYPSTCTWTVSGTGGSAQYVETMSTVTAAAGGVTYIHTDGLGSPVARTDAAGKVISRTRYEPYGYVATGAAPTIGFTGHVNDNDTGLTYMQQRYYDPVAGRFLSIDPVTTDANTGSSFNRYAYVDNNPYKYVDPDGRQSLDPRKIVIAKIVQILAKILVKTEKQAAQSPAKGAAKEVGEEASKQGGRNANKLTPDTKAEGPHSVAKRDAEGNTTNTATYTPNSKNPTGHDEVKRVDVSGKGHTNTDGTKVPTPHVHEAGVKDVRPALPKELPRQ